MKLIKQGICFTNRYIKENLLKYFLIVGIIFIVFGVVAFYGMKLLPEDVISEMGKDIIELFDSKDVVNADGTLSFWGIFLNNLRAGVLISVVGLIPFLFVPIIYVIFNALIVSAIFAVVSLFTEENLFIMFIKYILPHGIFEVPALIIEGAIGAKLCAFISRKIFRRAKEEKFVNHIKGFAGSFIFYVLPLLVIAAFIEAVVLSALYL